jgi:hypothetical protein
MISFLSGIRILMGGLPNHPSERSYWKGENLFTNMQESKKILSLNLIQMRETIPTYQNISGGRNVELNRRSDKEH